VAKTETTPAATDNSVAAAIQAKLQEVAPDLVEQFMSMVADHATQLETLEAQISLLKENLASSEALLKDLEAKLEEKHTAKVIELPTVKVGKVTYQVMYPKISHEGEILTAEDLVSNPDVCEALVKMESGALVPVQ